jgi:hypothetical protein
MAQGRTRTPSKVPVLAVDAVRRDLAVVAKTDKALSESALAATALLLAAEMDNPTNSATSKSMCAHQLRETMDRLRELVPEQKAEDRVDDLTARRAARHAARRAATAD